MSVLGESDAGGGLSHGVRERVRQKLLEHVPRGVSDAATVVTIAARAEMEIHAVRDHLACMPGIDSFDRIGRTWYYRKEEEMAKHDTRTMPVRIFEALDKGDVDGDGLTAIAIGAYISARPNTVTAELKILMAAGHVSRSGAGKRGDQYLYHACDEAHDGDVEYALASVRGDETAGNGATASPVAADRSEADTLASSESEDGDTSGGTVRASYEPGTDDENAAVDAELSKCYGAVIDDVTARAGRLATDAHALLDDAKVMTAAATLLMRILEGESDR